jgi:hypothetical protein
MARVYPDRRFERFADDAIVHCRSEAEARSVLEVVRGRLAECGLELHATKTRIVYGKDDDRPGEYEHIAFDFLGYTFQPRRAKNRWGRYFVSFLPAISTKAATAIRQTIRRWRMASTSRPSAAGGWRPPADHPPLADGVHQEQPAPGGSGSPHEPGGAGLAERLRAVLPRAVRPAWIMMRSATDLSKADLHVFSKLFDDGLERGQEAKAFSWRQIGGHDDVLDFFVGHLINVDMTRQPAP